MSETSPSSIKPPSHSKSGASDTNDKQRTGSKPIIWLILAGLVLINLAVLGCVEIFSKRAVSRLLFELQPAHWPWWYAVNLWLILIGLWGGFRSVWGKRLIALLFAVTVFCGSEWLSVPRQWLFGRAIALAILPYKGFYVPFVYGPMVEYRTTGLVSWRLATLPALGLLIIIVLLAVNRRIKNRRPIKNEERGDS